MEKRKDNLDMLKRIVDLYENTMNRMYANFKDRYSSKKDLFEHTENISLAIARLRPTKSKRDTDESIVACAVGSILSGKPIAAIVSYDGYLGMQSEKVWSYLSYFIMPKNIHYKLPMINERLETALLNVHDPLQEEAKFPCSEFKKYYPDQETMKYVKKHLDIIEDMLNGTSTANRPRSSDRIRYLTPERVV